MDGSSQLGARTQSETAKGGPIKLFIVPLTRGVICRPFLADEARAAVLYGDVV